MPTRIVPPFLALANCAFVVVAAPASPANASRLPMAPTDRPNIAPRRRNSVRSISPASSSSIRLFSSGPASLRRYSSTRLVSSRSIALPPCLPRFLGLNDLCGRLLTFEVGNAARRSRVHGRALGRSMDGLPSQTNCAVMTDRNRSRQVTLRGSGQTFDNDPVRQYLRADESRRLPSVRRTARDRGRRARSSRSRRAPGQARGLRDLPERPPLPRGRLGRLAAGGVRARGGRGRRRGRRRRGRVSPRATTSS